MAVFHSSFAGCFSSPKDILKKRDAAQAFTILGKIDEDTDE
tara:strand:+ start:512 stop:634 length:123 start_codon:yes stop_codon:yes gene_type:complete